MLKRLFVLLGVILSFSSYAATETSTGFAERPDVKAFIKEMVAKHKFREKELVKLFNSVKIRPTVMKKVRAPLEQRPWHTYQTLFVTEWRIRKGVEFWNKYQDVLSKIEKKYGVPASIIVATIGIETKYGLHTGEYPVIDALANIGFSNSPRAAFFKSELEEFLLLTREQHLNPLTVMGSYAGAIGQPQFMPSSYRHYAVSFSGKSKIDLSSNENDIIASIANYYKQKGWHTDKPIAVPASLVNNQFQFYVGKEKNVKIISQSSLAEYGLTIDKNAIKKSMSYKVIELQNYWGNEYWYGFHNFDVIKRYNSSDLYAMAVFQLSHYIATLREKLNEV
jgi:membrane-bound lytic murein transglycosylase B